MNIITNKIGAADFRIGSTATTIQKAYLGNTLVWEIGSGSDVDDITGWDLVAEVEWVQNEYYGTPNTIQEYTIYGGKSKSQSLFIPTVSATKGILKVRNTLDDGSKLWGALSGGYFDNETNEFVNTGIYGKLLSINVLYANWERLTP